MELNRQDSDLLIKQEKTEKQKNTYTLNELENLRKSIEKLEKNHHIEICKVLNSENIKLTENNNGIFINLNTLSNNVLDKIVNYLKFIDNMEKYINEDEIVKNKLENNFFKENKD